MCIRDSLCSVSVFEIDFYAANGHTGNLLQMCIRDRRNSTLTIELEDKPGQLSGVSDIISRCGGNVVSVHHNQSDTNMAITSCYLRVGMETRDHAQVEQIKQELAKAGFKLVANQQ